MAIIGFRCGFGRRAYSRPCFARSSTVGCAGHRIHRPIRRHSEWCRWRRASGPSGPTAALFQPVASARREYLRWSRIERPREFHAELTRSGRTDRGAHSGPARAGRRRRRLAADAAGERRRPESGRHRPAVTSRRGSAAAKPTCEAASKRWPPWAAAAARAPGASSSIVTHNFMLSQWPDQGQHDIWGEDPALPGERHLHLRRCGRARSVDGGYVLSGRWPLVSGVNTSDWCLFAALVDGGDVHSHRYFALPRRDIEIVDTWRSVGLMGSASNDVVVSEVFVPAHRTLSIQHLKGGPTPGNAHNRSPLYRTPSYCIFGIYITAAVLGIAEAGLELLSRGRPPSPHAHLEPEGRRLSHAAGQGRRGIGGDRRRAAAPVRHMRRSERDRRSATRCRATSSGRSSVRTPPSPDGWRPAPSSSCGMPAPAAASTAPIRCRASIAT